jgi:hypothetical protein
VEIFFSSADMQKTLTDRIYFLILKIPEWFFFAVYSHVIRKYLEIEEDNYSNAKRNKACNDQNSIEQAQRSVPNGSK